MLATPALAQTNLVTFGDFEGPAPGTQTGIFSPGFTQGPNTTFTIDDVVAYEGDQSVRVNYGGGATNFYDVQGVGTGIPVTPGEEYTFSVWARTGGGDGDGRLAFGVLTPGYAPVTPSTVNYGTAITGAWQEFGFTFTVPSDASYSTVNVVTQYGFAQNVGEPVYVDALSLVAAVPPPPTEGDVLALGDFEAFSPGTLPGGGTVNGTNYFRQVTGTSTFVIDGSVAYEGGQSLRANYDGSATNSFQMQFVPQVALEANEEYILSFWARTNASAGPNVNVNVQDPNAGYVSYGSSGSVTLTSDWQQIAFPVTSPVGTSLNIGAQFAFPNNAGSAVWIDNLVLAPVPPEVPPPPAISFESTAFSVVEGNTVQIPLVIRRTDDSPSTVRVSLVGGAGTADVADFETTIAAVTFDGERDSEVQVVEFTVADDGVEEGNETAVFRLSAVSGTAVVEAPNVIEVTISDAPPAGGFPLVVVEAEDGDLGAEWDTASDGDVDYAFVTTDFSAGANPDPAIPQTAARVASYDVTFPAPGTYTAFVRVYVGAGAFNDDSFLLASGPGMQDPTAAAGWVVVNGLAAGGFSAPGDVVAGAGTLGAGVWKWVRASAFPNNPADDYITVAAGDLTQTIQIGGREDGLWFDKIAFGLSGEAYTVADLDAGSVGGGGGANLLAFGDFEAPEPGSALTLDSGFIEANNGTFTIVDTEAHTGDQSLRADYTGGAANAYNFQFVAQPEVEPGTEYTASVWAKSTTAGGQMQFAVQNPSDFSALGTPFYGATLSAEWTEYEITFTVPEGLESVNVGLAFGYDVNIGNAVYIDDLSLAGPGGGGDDTTPYTEVDGSYVFELEDASFFLEGENVAEVQVLTELDGNVSGPFSGDGFIYTQEGSVRVTADDLPAGEYTATLSYAAPFDGNADGFRFDRITANGVRYGDAVDCGDDDGLGFALPAGVATFTDIEITSPETDVVTVGDDGAFEFVISRCYGYNYFDTLTLTPVGGGGGNGENVVTNGSFEDGAPGVYTGAEIPGWGVRNAAGVATPAEFAVVDDAAQDGDQSLRVTVAATGANAYDIEAVATDLAVTPGATYTYSVWARSENGGGTASFTVGNQAFSEYARLGDQTLTTEWQEFTFEFTVTDQETVIRAPIHFSYAGNVGNPVYIDNLSIRDMDTAVDAPVEEPVATLSVANPIRTGATVRYSLETAGDVSVALFDMLGRQVAVVADGPAGPQERSVRLDAAGLASGVYVLRLQGEDVMVSRTVTIVR
ncbi:hypothetical protein BSZ37_01860 [Rubrivirga marina]|uniref:CBM-cenC domain-containing protein n=1 Tax=Rubrivirga marina TaxID=1196024 RepID=A0A271IX30_9BACT|nr:hypothetical protein BSZ37_01860 [Rubrivirga marina]